MDKTLLKKGCWYECKCPSNVTCIFKHDEYNGDKSCGDTLYINDDMGFFIYKNYHGCTFRGHHSLRKISKAEALAVVV